MSADVRIVLTKEAYKELQDFAMKYLRNHSCDYGFKLLKHSDIKYEGEQFVYLGWDHVKWYGTEAEAIERGLYHLKEKDLSYRFSYLGDAYDDFVEHCHEGKKDHDGRLPYVDVERHFIDTDIIHEINLESSIKEYDTLEK